MSTAPESNRWVVLVIVCLAQFMVVLDATVVNVAFIAAALLVAVGAVLLMVLVRKRDVEGINPEAAAVPGV